MENKWVISKKDIEKIQNICKQKSSHKIYQERLLKNINNKINIYINKEILWESIFKCLLSTRQNSNKDSTINKFIRDNYHSICLSNIIIKTNIEDYILQLLKEVHGIRRYNIIAKEATVIYNFLLKSNWSLLEKIEDLINNKGNKESERNLSNYITNEKDLKGLGPKQSRNLLQMLGATIYEIPIDTRITKWLNENKIFPFKINSNMLSDIEFYCFINDVIIELCEKANVKPCLFDAAVFSLYEKL